MYTMYMEDILSIKVNAKIEMIATKDIKIKYRMHTWKIIEVQGSWLFNK